MTHGLNPRLSEKEAIQRCGWPACRAACCVYGTWIDLEQEEDILANAGLIMPHMSEGRRDPAAWFGEETEADAFTPRGTVRHTVVVKDPDHYGGAACIFLRGDYRCALQAAGDAAGLHPWRFKPFYCILHPLDLDEQGRITLDAIRQMVDEPASCVRRSTEKVVLAELFKEEIHYLTMCGVKGRF